MQYKETRFCRITPGDFIHIVTGKLEKDVLPAKIDAFEHRFDKPTDKQVAFLLRKGFTKINGLTKRQAIVLISIIIKRDKLGLADPWMLQVICSEQKLPFKTAYARYANMRKETAKLILDCRN